MLPVPYFSADGFVLYLGDCLPILAALPERSVDMIFADPPYNLSNGGFTCHAGRRAPVGKGEWDVSGGIGVDFEFHRAWIDGCRRVLRDGGTIWISGTYHSIYACGYALQALGFHILNDICWFKPNAPPNLSARYFAASHETLIWARKSKQERHTFNYKAMKEGDYPDDRMKNPGKQMRSVWSIPAPKRREKTFGKHPTQKPCALLDRIILASTREGDLVLDPFAGSSTTGLAARFRGRHFIGIDTSREYLALSVSRFNEMQDRLRDGSQLPSGAGEGEGV